MGGVNPTYDIQSRDIKYFKMGGFVPDPEKNIVPEFLWNQDKPDPRAPQKQPLAYISPMLRLPMSDAFGITFFSMQEMETPCAHFELRWLECVESYGFHRGSKKCGDMLEDVIECKHNTKEFYRYNKMQEERTRQYRAGERTKENRYADPPKMDTF